MIDIDLTLNTVVSLLVAKKYLNKYLLKDTVSKGEKTEQINYVHTKYQVEKRCWP